jgi:hypothetical protein
VEEAGRRYEYGKTYIPTGLDRRPRGGHSRPRRGGAIASAIACAANTVGSCRSLRRRRGQREQPRRGKNRVCTILSPSRPTRLPPLCQAPLQTLYAASTKVLAARTLVLLLSQPRAHQRRVARACSVAGSRPCPSMPSEADQRRPQHYRQQLRRTLPRRAPFGEAPFGRRRCISIKGEIAHDRGQRGHVSAKQANNMSELASVRCVSAAHATGGCHAQSHRDRRYRAG